MLHVATLLKGPLDTKDATESEVITGRPGGQIRSDSGKTLRQGAWNNLFPGKKQRQPSLQILNHYGNSTIPRLRVTYPPFF